MAAPAASTTTAARSGRSQPRGSTIALVILATLAVIAAMYMGRGLLIPIALALFLNTLLRPLVRMTHLKLKVPPPLMAAVVVLGLLGSVIGLGMALAKPAQSWLERAPDSLHNAQTKLRNLYQPLQKVSAAAADLGKGVAPSAPGRTVTLAPAPPEFMNHVFGTTATIIMGGVTTVLLLYLLLASGGVFLERLVGIVPTRANKKTATAIVSEVESAVAQYLAMTTVLNVAQAILVGIALHFVGMPSPLLWAVLTLVLEFIPYVGGAVLVALISVAALATFDSVGHAVIAPISYLVISALQNNVASPVLYGNRLKLNAVAVLVSVLFWGYMWGAVGALLAVPILATGKILCDHVDALGPIGKFLEA